MRQSTKVRRVEIVEVAMKVIASKGAKRFTAQLIADEVGMTAGGIFRHFANMDEIVEAIIDRMEVVLFDEFPPDGEDPWCRLREFLEQRIEIMVEHPDISMMLLSDHLSHLGGAEQSRRVQELKRRSQEFVTQCLREAAASGSLASGVTVGAATILVLGAILAVGHATTRVIDDSEKDRLTAEVWAAIEKLRHEPRPANRAEAGGHSP